MDANMQLTINSFKQLFADKMFFSGISLTFSKISDISLTVVKFPYISRSSRQVVTLNTDSCSLNRSRNCCFASVQTDLHVLLCDTN